MSLRGDVFKRPKEHHPEMALLKSPRQALLEELGLAEEDIKDQTSSSDGEEPMAPPVPQFQPQSPQSGVKELKQMLRETQRKLRSAQSSLVESEQSRERRLKIMRKTHQSAMVMKQALVQELQDVIADKEEYIDQMEARLKNGQTPPSSPLRRGSQGGSLKRLVEQISRLHRENTSLQSQYEETADQLEQLRGEREALRDELLLARSPSRPASSRLAQQVRELQQKVTRMEQERQTHLTRTNTQKELQMQVVDLRTQLRALLGEKEELLRERNKPSVDVGVVSRLEGESATLRGEVASLRTQAAALSTSERQLRMRVEALGRDLQKEREAARKAVEDRDAVKRELEAAQAKTCVLEGQVCGLEGVVGELERGEERLQVECRGLRERVHHLQEEVGGLGETTRARETEFTHKREMLRSECDALRSQLVSREAEFCSALQAAEERGRAQARGALLTLTTLREPLSRVHSSAVGTRAAILELRELTSLLTTSLQHHITSTCSQICQRIAGVSEHNRSLVGRYRREMLLRKKLHNKLVELRGNIRVFCRVRPPITEDGGGVGGEVVVRGDGEDDGVVHVLSRGAWKTFEADLVFGPQSTQEEVFEEVKPLVISSMDGYNVCIFAYGQTGSGKTFTMEGLPENPGINQRALMELFAVVAERSEDWEYGIVVSVLEIYNEAVRDLLSLDHTTKMEVKQGPEGVYVPGLTQVQVSCLQDINEVFALGHENRATGSTRMNIHSSRSHALLCVTVLGANRTTGVRTIGKLNLIDLAGSERLAKSGSDGTRLLEARHINKSLSALGDVIHSLRTRAPHTPYRNSKLTYLLQDSLSGDSKTLMVVQVAPVEKNVGETVCSLNFAQRVRAVELGQACRRVVDPTTERMKEYEGSPRTPTRPPRY